MVTIALPSDIEEPSLNKSTGGHGDRATRHRSARASFTAGCSQEGEETGMLAHTRPEPPQLYVPSDSEMRNLAETYLIGGRYKRIYFAHSRKTGGTSLNHLFYSLTGHDPDFIYKKVRATDVRAVCSGNLVYVAGNRSLISRGDYFYASSHAPIHQLQLPTGTFVVTTFRDPIERVLSHYRMLLFYTQNGIWKDFMEIEAQWLGHGFSDFIRLTPLERLANQLYMFSENFDIDEAYEWLINNSLFFHLEDFDNGINQLAGVLELPLKPIHVRKNSLTIIPNASDIDYLREILQKEYTLLDQLFKASLPTPRDTEAYSHPATTGLYS